MPYKTPAEAPTSTSFKKITLGFIIIVVLLLIFIIYFSFAKATITLNLGNEAKTQEFDLTVATSTDADLMGKVIDKEIEISQKFEVSKFEEKPGLATGKIKIINNHTANQQLIKTTRFLSTDNKLFRLKDNVSVPAGQEIEAEVYADGTGGSYNIPAGKFTIPGLDQNLQTKIYGLSETAMTGGVQKIGVLTDVDVQQAKTKFQENLKAKVKAELLKELAPTEKISDNLLTVEIKEETILEKIGEQVSNFTLTAKVNVQAVALDEEQLLSVAKEKYKQSLVALNLSDKISNWQVDSMQVQIKNFDTVNNKALINVKLTAEIGASFDVNKFDKKEIAGFDKKGVEYYFSQFAGIKSIDIKFWPFWVKSVPAVSDRINIEVK